MRLAVMQISAIAEDTNQVIGAPFEFVTPGNSVVSITEIVRVVPPTDHNCWWELCSGNKRGQTNKCTEGEKQMIPGEYFGATDDFDTPSNEQLHRGGDENL